MTNDNTETIKTVGDLKRALAGLPDDLRVVVDGYEGGYDDVTLRVPKVLLGVEYPYGGRHSGVWGWDDNDADYEVPPTLCLCLARGCYALEEDMERLASLRSGV